MSLIGQLLLNNQKITQEQLKQAIQEQEKTNKRLGEILKEHDLITDEDIADVLSKQFNLKRIVLSNVLIDRSVVSIIKEEVARERLILPFAKTDNELHIAVVDPTENTYLIDEIRFTTGIKKVILYITTPQDITNAINTSYTIYNKLEEFVKNLPQTQTIEEVKEESQSIIQENDPPLIKLVNSIIENAITSRASDIHIEPFENLVKVRYRIDGKNIEIMKLPKQFAPSIVSRIKIMSHLDIAEKRLPQDGRIKLKMLNKEIDLRVSSIPVAFGEKCVMRILDSSSIKVNLNDLGFEPEDLEKYIKAVKSPHGIILVTGPTGSGKSTTLYATLNLLNNTSVNILTAEDPIEYNLEGINQLQVNDEIGLTFAKALRSFLRQDPDIIMVGEIRDAETADIAIRAALTGHLVLSTLHTNDAPSAVARLIDMGVAPYLLASSLRLILAQRLVRKICDSCKIAYNPEPELIKSLGLERKDAVFYRGKGCPACNNTGYKGRVAIYETMPINEQIRKAIIALSPTDKIRDIAIKEGMQTLRQSGIKKVLDGITTIEEVLEVSI
ncbi:MAG: type IV-A pilus assembly ATPase PilB [Desulfurella sp.]